jgi:hypothetical protein
MEFPRYAAIVVMLIVVVVVWLADSCVRSVKNSLLSGVWVAPAEFCAASEIDGMILYVGDECGSISSKRKACLVMHAGDVTLAYKLLEIDFGVFDWFGGLALPFRDSVVYRVSVTDITDDDSQEITLEDIMPSDMCVEYNPVAGSMEWRAGDKVYAKLYKDNAASDI